ncbi:MAG: UvrD-helicase domain-containing protein, partial [Gemmatimonadaceae bacterium]|nr:UvrD-helicase domain-containing protein [Gemmatimonadaceae bacterium]
MRDVPSALPDQAARDTVVRALDETLLVEAGAGSGKTTLMVQRLLALLERGTAPGAIAAVTFTRKAATELRERLAQSLEERIASPTTAAEARATLARARDELDRAYVGTIHGFCSRLLREQALAAGLSPDFVELDEETAKMEGEAMLITAVDAAREQGAWGADALQALGIEPRELVSLALRLDGQPDVRFDVADAPPPDAAAFIAALDVLMEQAVALLPTTAPEKGWDSFQRLVHRWQVARAAFDASQPLAVVQFAELLEGKSARGITLERWRA